MDSLTIATHNQKLSLWMERICECQASNQTVADWCDANGVNMKTYYYWMRKIKCEAFDALPTERKTRALSTPFSKTTFAEIPGEQMTPVAILAMVFHLGTATLEIQNGADATTLEHTLRILRNLC